jgi:hypothetical protein
VNKKGTTMRTDYPTFQGLELARGNKKVGADTLIFNMSPATTCPSKARGLCNNVNICYAAREERNGARPTLLPYRLRQADYWRNHNAAEFITALNHILTWFREKSKFRIRYFRFNESGDLYGQSCVEKMYTIAEYLSDYHNVLTYLYTARKDLDFYPKTIANLPSRLMCVIKGSNWDGPGGKTIIIPKSVLGEKVRYYTHRKYTDEDGTTYVICKKHCDTCNFCKIYCMNVAFHQF